MQSVFSRYKHNVFVNGSFVLLHHGGLLGLQDVVGEDPGHGHLNGELDSATHGQLQEELSEPQLGQVTALLQGLWAEEGRKQGTENEGITFKMVLICVDWLSLLHDFLY